MRSPHAEAADELKSHVRGLKPARAADLDTHVDAPHSARGVNVWQSEVEQMRER